MATLKDVARECGVSVAAVSMALRGFPRIGAETAATIRAAADRLGYRPNSFGRALQSGRSRMIGVMIGGLSGSFFADIFDAICVEADRCGYGILAGLKGGEGELDRTDRVLSKGVDGLILLGGSSPNMIANQRKMTHRCGVPLLLCSFDPGEIGLPVVVSDHEAGGRLAASMLLNAGHRKFLCEYSRAEIGRNRGSIAEIQKYPGTEYTVFQNSEELPELVRRTGATALISYSDWEAIQAIGVLRKAGIRVPEDVSVVGYDDIELAALNEYRLSTIAQPKQQLGEISVRTLLAAINGEPFPIRQLLPVQTVRRHSIRTIHN